MTVMGNDPEWLARGMLRPVSGRDRLMGCFWWSLIIAAVVVIYFVFIR